MKTFQLITLWLVAFSLSACVNRAYKPVHVVRPMQPAPVIQKIDSQDIKKAMQEDKMMSLNTANSSIKIFGANGEGVAPLNTVSSAQALALAKKAAMADAYSQLASKLYGVKINATDTVRDAMLSSSMVDAEVRGLIKNATITKTQFKDGLYQVSMELRINEKRWKELFSY